MRSSSIFLCVIVACLATLAAASQPTCSLNCVSAGTFKTNTDTSLWTGSASGNITFCAAYIDYNFCPKAWNFTGTLFSVSQMDAFAKDWYTKMLSVHTSNCNAHILGNTCWQCEPALHPYACYYAFQPCSHNKITNVCYNACTPVLACQFDFDCVDTPLSPVAASGDHDCVGAGSMVNPNILFLGFLMTLQLFFRVLKL